MHNESYFGAVLVILNRGQKTRTPELPRPLHTSASQQRENVWTPTYDLTCNRPTYTADLQWNLEPSGPKVKTLPLGYHGPRYPLIGRLSVCLSVCMRTRKLQDATNLKNFIWYIVSSPDLLMYVKFWTKSSKGLFVFVSPFVYIRPRRRR
ncbi:hypothetical protein AVEN_107551-1 [Araneus ventricosus]|uniref:Uncharacterized protein n=1 Tax=Araneus ventricosus TaxID=182803 RepID=A0A4Y2M6S9_ARAVE|nr:hypothetical protein AVEN_107551-1 [Araneus ventricosus]